MNAPVEKKQPTHRVYHVTRDDNPEWIELGALWPHNDGEGYDLVLKVVPVGGFNGRLTLRTIKPKKEPTT